MFIPIKSAINHPLNKYLTFNMYQAMWRTKGTLNIVFRLFSINTKWVIDHPKLTPHLGNVKVWEHPSHQWDLE